MDFGVVCMDMDCLMGPEPGEGATAHSHVSGPETKPGHGSGLSFKQQRSWPVEDAWRVSKTPKPDDMSSPRTMPLPQEPPPQLLMRSSSLAPPRQEQMLSFASNKSDVTFLSKDGGASSDFAFYQRMPAPYARNAGFGSGSLNANMHGPYAAARGPFTPSQWIELEHQALIYKYLNANAPVPSNLLIPLKKSLYHYGLSGPSPNSLSWGSFHLGYSGSTDPEPGRCRRTDGKKWRCSRDAVADQKYCERHINRGRHRSRKPVEGQTGHGASRRANSKEVAPPVTSSKPTSVSGTLQPQFKSLEPPPPADAAAANSSVDAFANRMQDPQGFTVMSASSIKPESNASCFSVPKRDFPMVESSQSEFGLVSTDSLLNPSHRSSYIPKDFGGSFLDFTDQETQDQNLLHQFIDDWPKDQSSQSVVTWPEDIKSDWTRLSMAIPMASDFSSSSSSPTQDKLGLSPLRLSREFEPTQNLGVSNDQCEPSDQQTNWVPISWRSSMGGPLGEVLTNTSSCVNSKNSSSNTSPLNLLNEGWDGSSQLESSPTGVLQKSTFCSLSNSSSGCSPRADNKKSQDGASLYDDVLGSTLGSSSVPSL
ncbi:PREDICTED: growth-regulating factor 1-like [Fragaria vesca subsp. vesca]|uniref:growth-regulating factor 1-like n=1 Tax=Fragaria vesca subsp. vesca TaxID=101020 RepID=UPI0002C342DF|nr:PREDICTED: growth-regulating factor 1-like [Fragaria vesca subsp. vesca]